jgi:hypothetical protein
MSIGDSGVTVRVIIEQNRENDDAIDELTIHPLADEVTFITQNDMTSSELLMDLIFEDFIRCR